MDKPTLRREMKARRKEAFHLRFGTASPEAETLLARRLFHSLEASGLLKEGEKVFSYASFRTELPTDELNRCLMARGWRVLLPRMGNPLSGDAQSGNSLSGNARAENSQTGKPWSGGENHMDFFPANGELKPHRLGVWEPQGGEAAFPEPGELFLVPGLAFDLWGGRLGYGAGYYDRYFARFPEATKVGLGFSAQILRSKLPTEDQDWRMDYLLCEAGLYDVGKGCFI